MDILQLFPPDQKNSLTNNQFSIPSSMGRGGITHIPLNCGMQLVVADYEFYKPTVLEYTSPSPHLGFGFCLSGEIEASSSCLKDSFSIKAGQSVCFSFPDSAGFTEKVRPGPMVRVSVLMKPGLLPSFGMGDPERLPKALTDENTSPSRFSDTITPNMRAVIDQIRSCPYHGVARSLFIEAKVMELTAHKMAQLDTETRIFDPKSTLAGPDIERVRRAARLLTRDLEETPTMAELARSVGMCRSKLYDCFKMVYGITPLDYLRNKRLETAVALLNEGKTNVTQVSYAVGYASLSHFSKTFKKHFGFSPGRHPKAVVSSAK